MKPPEVAGLYAHFPWCVKKCPYCDFNSHPLRATLPERNYVDALLDDLRRERQRFDNTRFTTVYFGGGTPSLFSPESFRTLLANVPEASEVTLEANPGTVEHGDFAAYRRAGVTRVSLGAQSFDAAQLRTLGRIHGADDTRRAAKAVADAGFDSFNLDVMYGLPGQTVAAALCDLDQAIRLAAPHISWYQLTVEPKTEFARRPPAGLPDGDSAAVIEAAGVELLARHGYRRYEVSAFARDGHRCAHNVNYWRFGDYAGIGRRCARQANRRRRGGSLRQTRAAAHLPQRQRRQLGGGRATERLAAGVRDERTTAHRRRRVGTFQRPHRAPVRRDCRHGR